MTVTSKRARSTTPLCSSDDDLPDSDAYLPVTKITRATSETAPLYTCTLPPTCNENSQQFTTLSSLNAHHASYHSFICRARPSTFEFAQPKRPGPHRLGYERQDECLRVFPSQFLLDAHFSECHDELRRAQEAKGLKTFACLHPSCTSFFSTPKTRRRHLIEKHDYPKQYFFGVTIWGVAEVLKKGGGMIRRDWKPRESTTKTIDVERSVKENEKVEEEEEDGTEMVEMSGSESPERFISIPTKPSQTLDRVDDLVLKLQGTSIGLVPRSVRKAAQRKSSNLMVTDSIE